MKNPVSENTRWVGILCCGCCVEDPVEYSRLIIAMIKQQENEANSYNDNNMYIFLFIYNLFIYK